MKVREWERGVGGVVTLGTEWVLASGRQVVGTTAWVLVSVVTELLILLGALMSLEGIPVVTGRGLELAGSAGRARGFVEVHGGVVRAGNLIDEQWKG